ncbi:MAG: asparagine synthase-related protein [Candidatus Competibacteraceae bacterium]
MPFLDHELVELALRMPPALKIRDGGKTVLKQPRAAGCRTPLSTVPKGISHARPEIRPAASFSRSAADILNSRACRDRGLFQRSYVERLLADPEAHFNAALRGSKLWHLALLECWLQLNVDAADTKNRKKNWFFKRGLNSTLA